MPDSTFVGDNDHGDAVPTPKVEALVKELEQTRRERDLARMEVCMILAGKVGKSSSICPDALEHAERRGWDCFSELSNRMATNEALQRLSDLDHELGIQ